MTHILVLALTTALPKDTGEQASAVNRPSSFSQALRSLLSITQERGSEWRTLICFQPPCASAVSTSVYSAAVIAAAVYTVPDQLSVSRLPTCLPFVHCIVLTDIAD